ncbi:hypothetical protein NQZ68_036315 [Dissostichus eleginoides]|nr:hypothetical protein NQZ68_036315 [Dissostichus eleginoides]
MWDRTAQNSRYTGTYVAQSGRKKGAGIQVPVVSPDTGDINRRKVMSGGEISSDPTPLIPNPGKPRAHQEQHPPTLKVLTSTNNLLSTMRLGLRAAALFPKRQLSLHVGPV